MSSIQIYHRCGFIGNAEQEPDDITIVTSQIEPLLPIIIEDKEVIKVIEDDPMYRYFGFCNVCDD